VENFETSSTMWTAEGLTVHLKIIPFYLMRQFFQAIRYLSFGFNIFPNAQIVGERCCFLEKIFLSIGKTLESLVKAQIFWKSKFYHSAIEISVLSVQPGLVAYV